MKLKWVSAAAAALFAIGAANAAPSWVDYTAESFTAMQAEGKTIVVDVFASWCPVCKVQGPILDELRNEPALADAIFIKVDFDEEKDFLQAHRIPRQSTVLVFQGREEVGRSIAESDRGRLREFVLGSAAK